MAQALPVFPHRVYAYVAMAMNDATIAAWDSKCYYNRPRPSQMDHNLATAAAVPNSPSYPSEHSATAWAAATVLAHLIPADAAAFLAMADQAGKSRVLAGLQFPSDDDAGAELGRRVAAEVIKQADADGSGDSGDRTGSQRGLQLGGHESPATSAPTNWTPILLSSPRSVSTAHAARLQHERRSRQELAGRQELPARPDDAGGVQYQLQGVLLAEPGRPELLAVPIRGQMDVRGRRPAQSSARRACLCADRRDRVRCVHRQPGRQVYLLVHSVRISSIRISSRSFPFRHFPSYPSNHSTFSATRSEILAYLFPAHATFIRGVGKEAGDSQIWAGIHYQMDNVAGVNLGRSVAGVFIARAQQDGSQ